MKHEIQAVITELNDNPDSQLLGKATLIVNNSIKIRNISIYNSSNGPYVRMPREVKTDKNGISIITEIVRISYPVMNSAITNAVISAYNYAKAFADSDKRRAEQKAREIAKYGISYM